MCIQFSVCLEHCSVDDQVFVCFSKLFWQIFTLWFMFRCILSVLKLYWVTLSFIVFSHIQLGIYSHQKIFSRKSVVRSAHGNVFSNIKNCFAATLKFFEKVEKSRKSMLHHIFFWKSYFLRASLESCLCFLIIWGRFYGKMRNNQKCSTLVVKNFAKNELCFNFPKCPKQLSGTTMYKSIFQQHFRFFLLALWNINCYSFVNL